VVQGSGEDESVLTASAIAELVGGTLVGAADAVVTGIAPLDRAGERHLSFLALPKYAKAFEESSAGVVLIAPDLAEAPGRAPARVVVPKPHDAVLKLLPVLYKAPQRAAEVHATAAIGRGSTIGSNVSIGAYAVVGAGARIDDGATIGAHAVVGDGARVGAQSVLHAHATLYPRAVVGERVIIHAGARIGSDGFGYVQRGGAHVKIPHVGGCVVEDDVEIGANTTIDRGSIDDTVIGAGTKIDNLVHVAHNVRIGRLCLIMAQVGIAGSVRVEDGCILAGQVGISGHHTIGRGAQLAAQAGVFGDVPAGEVWSGYPARPHKEALRAQAALFKLAPLFRRLEKLLDASGGGERESGKTGG
jgi:UDP-3-O-[3-hydroxymyristoyl] glucosamine N-acyltransferase